jgi:hypothetical protein
LTEITAVDVALFDPALDDGPTRLVRDGFLLACGSDYLQVAC